MCVLTFNLIWVFAQTLKVKLFFWFSKIYTDPTVPTYKPEKKPTNYNTQTLTIKSFLYITQQQFYPLTTC